MKIVVKIISGLLITLILLIVGYFGYRFIKNDFDFNKTFGIGVSDKLIEEKELEVFNNILVDFNTSNVEIKHSIDNNYKVLIYSDHLDSHNIEVNEEGVKVSLKEKKLRFLDRLFNHKQSLIVIYIPSDYEGNITVNGDVGNLKTDDYVSRYEVTETEYSKQVEISTHLDKLYSIIKMREEELGKLDELIKARFVELFGDISINDKGWDIEPLGNLCTIVRGGSPRPIEHFLGGDVPWIKIGDATDGDNIYLNSTKEHIIQEGVKKSRLVKAGSLIFANCGVSLGFARIITFDGCIHDGWLAMEDIDERLDKVFLLQALNQMTEQFRAIAPAGTQPNLNTAIMKAYRQVLPPLELQKEFIAFAKQVDKSKVVDIKVA